MTDEVAALVLRNNYLQTLALSLAQRRGLEDLGFQQRLMQTLEQRGELDRAVEFLPDDMEIAERVRRQQPLTRPELSVLLAYAKLSLYADLLDSKVPDDPYLGRELGRYFPKLIAQKFPDALEKHRLRREIIATQLANSMINRGGPSLVVRIADQTGASPAAIAVAFAAVRDSYDMPALQRGDQRARRQGRRARCSSSSMPPCRICCSTGWSGSCATPICRRASPSVVEHYREGIAALTKALDKALPPGRRGGARGARGKELVDAGVPEALARRIADIPEIAAAPDVVLIADRTKKPIAAIVATYFAAEAYFRRRPRGDGGARHRGVGLLRPARARPRARFDRRRRAPADRGDGRDRRDRRGGGRGLGQAAPGRGRAHPLGDPPDRRLRADAVEADGGGEPARRSGARLNIFI